MSFLTTRVRRPDEDDWGKLKRVLSYLHGTRNLALTIGVDSLGFVRWYVDGSHNVHADCRGHGGTAMFLGRGAVSSYSRKLKGNTKSSTQTELFAAGMYLPKMLWSLYFMQAQGYETQQVQLYQDNLSTQFLEINGKFSSSKKTKHIKAKYFFIKSCVDAGEVRITDCPTDEMWADVETKPLQGKAFRVMRAGLMNCGVDYDDEEAAKMMAAGSVDGSPSHAAASQNNEPLAKLQRARRTQSVQECVGPSRVQQRSQFRNGQCSQFRIGLGAARLTKPKEVRKPAYGAQRRMQMAGRKMRVGMKGGTGTNRYVSRQ